MLLTSTDRFHPDFITELTDGCILVADYKGAHLVDISDSREKCPKRTVWADASNAKCLFAMVTAPSAASGRTVADQIPATLVYLRRALSISGVRTPCCATR
jgi:type III restriction enzyme